MIFCSFCSQSIFLFLHFRCGDWSIYISSLLKCFIEVPYHNGTQFMEFNFYIKWNAIVSQILPNCESAINYFSIVDSYSLTPSVCLSQSICFLSFICHEGKISMMVKQYICLNKTLTDSQLIFYVVLRDHHIIFACYF